MKNTFVIIWILGVKLHGLAQVLDTVQLTTSRISVFKQAESLDSNLLNHPLALLGQVLKENSSIQIQEYGGRGAIQSVLIRGLTSNHTKVKWNGLQINSLALGMFDFGGISSFGNNYLQLNKGANVENDGDGAVGGSIYFGSDQKFNQGTQIKCHFLGGSFNTNSLSVVSSISRKKWIYSLAFNKEMANNNFKYKNYKRIGNPVIKQSNSEFRSTNLIQEVGFKFKKVKLKSISWWNGKRKNIPLLLTESRANKKIIADSSFRTVLQAKTHLGKLLISSLVGRDRQWFKYVNPEIVNTYYKLTNDQGEIQMSSNYKELKWSLKSNLQAQKAINTNYDGVKKRFLNFNSANIKGGIKEVFFKATTGFQIASDLNRAYPTTSIGYTKKINSFELKGGAGTHFRQPTFNDFFWKSGGNSELTPETGWSIEQFLSVKKSKKLSANLGGYYSVIENWIQWIPLGSIWEPNNVKKVGSSGVESEFRVNQKLIGIKSVFFNTSSFTRTTVLESNLENDPAIGKQTVNVPFFNSTNNIQLQFKSCLAKYSIAYKGKRYISFDNDENSALPGYWLSSFGVTKIKKLKDLDLAMDIKITNLFNKAYEIIGNTPMPGRAYYFSLTFKFKKDHT